MGICRVATALSAAALSAAFVSGKGLEPPLRGLQNVGRRVAMTTDDALSWTRDPCRDYLMMVDNGATHVVVGGSSVPSFERQEREYRERCVRWVSDRGGQLILSVKAKAEGNPVQFAEEAAKWVAEKHFHGLDIDFGNLEKGFGDDEGGFSWMVACMMNARRFLDDLVPSRRLELSMSPKASYFTSWAGANQGFVQLAKVTKDAVDTFYVQYHDMGSCKYDSYESLFVRSDCPEAPGSSISEIKEKLGATGVRLQVGKPVFQQLTGHVNKEMPGYVGRDELVDMMCRAEAELGYSGGIRGWSFQVLADEQASLTWVKEMVNGCPSVVNRPRGVTAIKMGSYPQAVTSSSADGCYVSHSWWESSCESNRICQYDGSIKNEADCRKANSSSLPAAFWGKDREACKAANPQLCSY